MTKEVICGEVTGDCAFHVRSDDEDEVVDVVQRHAETKHAMSLSHSETRDLVQDA